MATVELVLECMAVMAAMNGSVNQAVTPVEWWLIAVRCILDRLVAWQNILNCPARLVAILWDITADDL